jgi:hypothetical protein
MTMLRNFLSLVAVVVATTPAWGQAAPLSVPDFSGVWAHLTWPDFEPPLSGPGPVTNRSRRAGAGDNYQLVGDYTNPILQPWAADVVKKFGEISLAGEGYPTPRNQCWPEQVPFVFINYGMQLLQQPDKITILYPFNHQFRQVRMNDSHPAQVTPSWYGDSVGHYEGDTLVIDTVGVKIGPFAMVDFYGTPYTKSLHVVERYRLIDYEHAKEGLDRDARENWRPAGPARSTGMHLQLHFTVEDEGEGFNVQDIPDPCDPANLFKSSGRGVLLIYNIMDEVKYNDRGNRLTMVKKADNEEEQNA